MGRYYSRHDGNLYIFVTKNDLMVDLSLFPPELELFDHAEPRRVNGKMAIVKGITESNVDKAEIILSLNGFKKKDLPKEILEQYYDSGDETVLDGEYPPKREAVARDNGKAVDGEGLEVIIPRAKSPTLGYNEDEREKSQSGPEAPSDEVQRAHEARQEEHGSDQGRTPISEEELIDSLVLWIRSQGIQIEKEREPPKTEPTTQVQDELVELLNEAMRAKTGQKPAHEDEASVDELLREMAVYNRGTTSEPKEAERPKTALEELLEQANELLKSRSQPAEEEIQRAPIQGPFSIEEEIDRHIVEYVKSRLPIKGSDIEETRGPPSNELHRRLPILRWSEKVAPLKTEGKTKFPEEVLKLLGELLKKEKQES